jgi:hypothetical protein
MATSDIDKVPETTADLDRRAWLVLAVGTNRQHGGNDGYDDEPESHYGWDDTGPQSCRAVRGGRDRDLGQELADRRVGDRGHPNGRKHQAGISVQ